MIKKGTRSFVIMTITMAAMKEEFFNKMPKEKKIMKIKEWTENSLKKAKEMGATTDDDITEIFSESKKIKFTEKGEIKIQALDPDKETLEIIEEMKLRKKK